MKSAEEWVDTVVVFNEEAARAIQIDALKWAKSLVQGKSEDYINDAIVKLEKQSK